MLIQPGEHQWGVNRPGGDGEDGGTEMQTTHRHGVEEVFIGSDKMVNNIHNGTIHPISSGVLSQLEGKGRGGTIHPDSTASMAKGAAADAASTLDLLHFIAAENTDKDVWNQELGQEGQKFETKTNASKMRTWEDEPLIDTVTKEPNDQRAKPSLFLQEMMRGRNDAAVKSAQENPVKKSFGRQLKDIKQTILTSCKTVKTWIGNMEKPRTITLIPSGLIGKIKAMMTRSNTTGKDSTAEPSVTSLQGAIKVALGFTRGGTGVDDLVSKLADLTDEIKNYKPGSKGNLKVAKEVIGFLEQQPIRSDLEKLSKALDNYATEQSSKNMLDDHIYELADIVTDMLIFANQTADYDTVGFGVETKKAIDSRIDTLKTNLPNLAASSGKDRVSAGQEDFPAFLQSQSEDKLQSKESWARTKDELQTDCKIARNATPATITKVKQTLLSIAKECGKSLAREEEYIQGGVYSEAKDRLQDVKIILEQSNIDLRYFQDELKLLDMLDDTKSAPLIISQTEINPNTNTPKTFRKFQFTPQESNELTTLFDGIDAQINNKSVDLHKEIQGKVLSEKERVAQSVKETEANLASRKHVLSFKIAQEILSKKPTLLNPILAAGKSTVVDETKIQKAVGAILTELQSVGADTTMSKEQKLEMLDSLNTVLGFYLKPKQDDALQKAYTLSGLLRSSIADDEDLEDLKGIIKLQLSELSVTEDTSKAVADGLGTKLKKLASGAKEGAERVAESMRAQVRRFGPGVKAAVPKEEVQGEVLESLPSTVDNASNIKEEQALGIAPQVVIVLTRGVSQEATTADKKRATDLIEGRLRIIELRIKNGESKPEDMKTVKYMQEMLNKIEVTVTDEEKKLPFMSRDPDIGARLRIEGSKVDLLDQMQKIIASS